MIETTKRCLRVAAGWGLVTAGIILIPLPGPGLPVVLAGLVVLSKDSARARRMMGRLREYLRSKRGRRVSCEGKSPSSSPSWF